MPLWHACRSPPPPYRSAAASLIEAGFTLAWKRVEIVHELAVGLMVFFSGALVPLDRLPAGMAEIGRFAPISQGIVALRSLLVDSRSTIGLAGDRGMSGCARSRRLTWPRAWPRSVSARGRPAGWDHWVATDSPGCGNESQRGGLHRNHRVPRPAFTAHASAPSATRITARSSAER